MGSRLRLYPTRGARDANEQRLLDLQLQGGVPASREGVPSRLHSARVCTPWPSQRGAASGPGCGGPARNRDQQAMSTKTLAAATAPRLSKCGMQCRRQRGQARPCRHTFCTSCARSRVASSSDRLIVLTFMLTPARPFRGYSLPHKCHSALQMQQGAGEAGWAGSRDSN